MGRVWRAIELATNRVVALKVIAPELVQDEQARQRFAREIAVAARLDHPGIVKIFHGGVSDGQPYYAMEWVRGRSMDEFVASERLGKRAIVSLMLQVCEAVHCAHVAGVIHRDLKPANILVDSAGKIHVLDFGLARSQSSQADGNSISRPGEVAGTLEFMSPEQVRGEGEMLDSRSDVYALGVNLYKLLTGRSPHDMTGGFLAVARRRSEDEPRRPRTVSATVDRELEAVLLKALARDPSLRYQTAGELAGDLKNYLRGDPLKAKPPTVAYILGRRIRQYRGRALVMAVVIFFLVAVATVSIWRTVIERNRAIAAEAQSRIQLARTLTERAYFAAGPLGNPEAMVWLAEAVRSRELTGGFDSVGRTRAGDMLRHAAGLKQLSAVPARPILTHFNEPKQEWMIVGADGTVEIWTLTPHGLKAKVELGLELKRAVASADSHLVALAGTRSAIVLDAHTATKSGPALVHDADIQFIGVPNGGERAFTLTRQGHALVWDLRTGQVLRRDAGEQRRFSMARPLPDGLRMLVVESSGARAENRWHVAVWDMYTGESKVASPDRPNVLDAAMDSEGNAVLLGQSVSDKQDGFDLILEKFAQAEGRADVTQTFSDVTAFEFNDRRHNLFMLTSRSAQVLDLGTLTALPLSNPRLGSDWNLSLSDNQEFLGGSRFDGMFCVWNAVTGAVVMPPTLHESAVAQWLPLGGGREVLTVSREGVLRRWSQPKPEAVTLSGEGGPLLAVVPNPRGDLAAMMRTRSIDLFDPKTHKHLAIDNPRNDRYVICEFDPAGRRLAIGTSAGGVRIVSVPDGKPIAEGAMPTANGFVRALTWSSDGRVVVMCGTIPGGGGEIQAFRSDTGATFGSSIRAKASWAAIDSTGTRLAAIEAGPGRDSPAAVYDLPSGRRTSIRWDGHRPNWVAFAQNDEVLVLADESGHFSVWSAGDLAPSVKGWPAGLSARGPNERWVLENGRLLRIEEAGVRVVDSRTEAPMGPLLAENQKLAGLGSGSSLAMVLTSSAQGFVQFWDGRDGLPITEPFATASNPRATAIMQDGTVAIVPRTLTEIEVRDLSPDGRPITEILQSTNLLAARRRDESGSLRVLSRNELVALWNRFGGK